MHLSVVWRHGSRLQCLHRFYTPYLFVLFPASSSRGTSHPEAAIGAFPTTGRYVNPVVHLVKSRDFAIDMSHLTAVASYHGPYPTTYPSPSAPRYCGPTFLRRKCSTLPFALLDVRDSFSKLLLSNQLSCPQILLRGECAGRVQCVDPSTVIKPPSIITTHEVAGNAL
ncbi:hypothetical protein HPB50_020317 [Hyalomma asiaticum]|uniref:Uncharacterized protein n=1 Tax=Hyalomma asiaticum TaxID=266040 RepID=A0ACB7RL84_HYAAI|nr:hypothetical protein HPB50_020317 [Hyalomma asiaticum]